METDTLLESKSLINKPKFIRSFGRIKSRKLSNHKNQLLDANFKKYLIDNINIEYFDDNHQNTQSQNKLTPSNFNSLTPINFNNISLENNPQIDVKILKAKSVNHLEIGFGFGDFIFNKAKLNPDIDFYGCEPHLNGIVNLLSMLDKTPLDNIKINNQDIRILIDKFPDNFFEKIYILFADPWPKSKHFKRRLINQEFLDYILAPKLKNNGIITIATDHDSYKTWILSHILKSQKYKWTATNSNSWQNFPNDWIITKYQKKALAENRTPILIEIIKQND